uniref:Gag-Pol polyprotein n=1 Tax=Tanacetum cinerariifolium TaxID=118510 RepID=A0A6L2MAH5_TANCI|nr:hypothetical protein [Tanacetum cinerariifolium]
MRGTVQNKVDRETRFNNKFDEFVAEPGEVVVSVYNRFAQLMNDLERNGIKFPPLTVNTKFLNCLQPEWLKYVTQVCFTKRLTEDTYDDLFDYLHQYEKLVNISRAKKFEKTHDPLAVVAHTDPHTSAMMLLSRAITQRFSNPTNNRLGSYSNTKNQAIVQADRVNIHSRNSGTHKELFELHLQDLLQMFNATIVVRKMLLAKQDEAGVTLIDEQNDFPVDDASRMEEIKKLSANIYLMARIQLANINFDVGPNYDSAFLSKVQTSSTSYENPLFAKDNQEQKYPKQPKIINDAFGDDQIDSNIIFDEPNVEVNSGSVEYDNIV